MHSANYAIARCLSVRLSVRHTPILCQNGWTYPQTFFIIRQLHYCSMLKTIFYGNIATGRRVQWGYNNRGFRSISRCISKMIQDTTIYIEMQNANRKSYPSCWMIRLHFQSPRIFEAEASRGFSAIAELLVLLYIRPVSVSHNLSWRLQDEWSFRSVPSYFSATTLFVLAPMSHYINLFFRYIHTTN